MVLLPRRVTEGAPNVSPPAGPDHRKVPQIAFNPIGPNTPRQRPSSATIRCSMCCRLASWSSRHRHPGEHGDKARKLGIPVLEVSATVARKRHPSDLAYMYALNSFAAAVTVALLRPKGAAATAVSRRERKSGGRPNVSPPSHRVDRSDRQLRRRSKEETEDVGKKMKTRPSRSLVHQVLG